MITDPQFRRAALLLKNNSSHDAWENFIGAMRSYAFGRIEQVVNASLDQVVIAQGRAQQARTLLELIEDCEPKPQGGPHVQR